MRPMKITTEEIIERINTLRVIKIKQITEELGCSSWTLFNKLKDHKYYTSYNFNRQYITLKEIPNFNSNGLWEYQGVRFSKWENVEETIFHIINESRIGLSPGEISNILQIGTHNQLHKCIKKGTVIRKRYGKNQIYYSGEEEIRNRQVKTRETEALKIESIKLKPLSYKTIIDILLVIVKYHEIKPKNIVSILLSEGKKVSEQNIEWVLQKYEIKKRDISSSSRQNNGQKS